jgi:carboxylate-amine ligase
MELLDQVLQDVREDASELGIEPELLHLRHIATRGTSAHWQLNLFERLRKQGLSPTRAMQELAKWLRASTEVGCPLEHELKQPG